MTSLDELRFFDDWPQLIPLYETLRNTLEETYPDLRIKVSKTQISFYNKHMFAMASLPLRRKKDWPREFLMVSFGLDHPVESPKIAVCTEAYPGRWTHHVLVKQVADIDKTLLSWIHEAYTFSAGKR